MLVVVLSRADHRLPSSVYELYQLAIDTCLDAFAHRSSQQQAAGWKERVLEGVRAVAYHNHVRKERLFTHDFGNEHSEIWEDVCACGTMHITSCPPTKQPTLPPLPPPPLHTRTHAHIHGAGSDTDAVVVSFIKVVSQRGQYQFSHLSFQEFLFLDHTTRCAVAVCEPVPVCVPVCSYV